MDDNDEADNDDAPRAKGDDEWWFGMMNPLADEANNNKAHNTAEREAKDFIVV